MAFKDFLHRVLALIIRPDAEWQAIAVQRDISWRSVVRHALLMSAIAPMTLAIGLSAFGTPPALLGQATPMAADSPMALAVGQNLGTTTLTIHAPARAIDPLAALKTARDAYFSLLAAIFSIAAILWLMAPYCDGQRSALGALQVAVYGSTPLCVAAVGLLHPYFYLLLAIGVLHSTVVIHAGVRRILQTPKTQAAVLIGVTVILFQIGAPLATYLFSAIF